MANMDRKIQADTVPDIPASTFRSECTFRVGATRRNRPSNHNRVLLRAVEEHSSANLIPSPEPETSRRSDPGPPAPRAGSCLWATAPRPSLGPVPVPRSATNLKTFVHLLLGSQLTCGSGAWKRAFRRILTSASFHGVQIEVEVGQYVQLYPLTCNVSLNPHPHIKALGSWIKYYSLRDAVQITQSARGVFLVRVSSTLQTVSKVQRKFRMHMNILGPLACHFAIPLLRMQRRESPSVQTNDTERQIPSPSLASGIAAALRWNLFTSQGRAEILEEYYQIFLSRETTRPDGHSYGSDPDRTPRNSVEPSTPSRFETTNTPSFSGTTLRTNANDGEREEGTAVAKNQRTPKSAYEKKRELRCPFSAAGRGNGKCLTYSTKFVHRLKSDHLIPDHRLEKASLDLRPRKQGESEESKWDRLFPKVIKGWDKPLPSCYYSANYQPLIGLESLLRSEADRLGQESLRTLSDNAGASNTHPYSADDYLSQPPAQVNQVLNSLSYVNEISSAEAERDTVSPYQAVVDEQNNSFMYDGVVANHIDMQSLPATSYHPSQRVPWTSGTSSSESSSLSPFVSGSDFSHSVTSSIGSCTRGSSLTQTWICRCKRHSEICKELQNNATPRSDSCKGCHGVFSWSDKATPFIISGEQGSGLCRCGSHSPECIIFRHEYDAGKCTCCKGWMPFSDRATPFLLAVPTTSIASPAGENDYSGMMDWNAASL